MAERWRENQVLHSGPAHSLLLFRLLQSSAVHLLLNLLLFDQMYTLLLSIAFSFSLSYEQHVSAVSCSSTSLQNRIHRSTIQQFFFKTKFQSAYLVELFFVIYICKMLASCLFIFILLFHSRDQNYVIVVVRLRDLLIL